MQRRFITAVAALGCAAHLAYANPTGPVVVHGTATFATGGGVLSVTNSPSAIINWRQFSIGANETTRFIQQSSSSAVLNRVVGQDPSRVFGSLQSNGRVFLINPSGIVFGPNSQIDTAGLVASSLNLSNADFIAGRMNFTGDAARAAAVINQGRITASEGGRVYLVGSAVDNEGVITAPNGNVVLAAGKSVRVTESVSGVQVEITAPADRPLNLSELDFGRRGAYAGLVRNSGTITADSVVRGADGSIVLKASRKVALDAGSVVSASGPDGGGNIVIDGQYVDVAPGAQIRADAQVAGDGGRVLVWADKTARFYGSISARGGPNGGNGGAVEVSGKETLVFKGNVDTRAPKGKTGTLLLDPLAIVIQAGSGDGDDLDALNNSFAGDPSGGAGTVLAPDITPTILFQSELEGIAATTNISLAATNSITINPLTGGNLNLAQNAGRSVSFTSGTFSMSAGDTITTAGGALNITTTTGGAAIGNLATNGGAVTLNLAGASTVAGGISGAGTSLTKQGAGTLTLNGASSYTGPTIVSAGTLTLGAAGVLPGATALTVNGTGTLNIAGFNQTVGSVQLTAGTISGSGGTLTSGTPYDLRSGTVSAILGGAVGLNKTTAGTVILSGANTYTGATAVNAGTLAVTVDGALGTAASGTTVDTTATLDLRNVAYGTLEPLTLNGGTLATSTGTSSFANTVNLTLSSNATVDGTQLTLNGAVNGGAGVSLTKTGAGTLAMGASNLLADTLSLVVNGGTFNIAGFSDTVTGVQLLSGTIAGSGGTLTSTTPYDMQSGAVSAILGGAVGLNKTTAGTVTLSGVNTYSGVTSITGGVLSAGFLANGGSASNIGQSSNAAGNLVLGGGTLQYTGASVANDRNFTLTAGTTGTIDVAAGGTNLTLTGSAAATTGGLTKAGAGTLTLQNTHPYTGNTTVTAGTLALGASDRLADASQLVVSGGTFSMGTFNETQAGVHLTGGAITSTTGQLTSTSTYDLQAGSASAILTGAVGATKTGAGTVTLSGVNTYTGPTTINAGVLSVGFLANGGLASNIGLSSNAAANLVLGGGTLQYTGATVTNDRNYTLTAGTTSAIDVAPAGTNLSLIGTSAATTGALTKLGAGTLTFLTPQNYTGLTTVSAGTLAYGVNNALASGPVTVSGGTLNIGTFSDTVGFVTLVDGSIAGTTGVLTGSSYEVQNGTISAILAGGGSLTKTTAGTVTLSGNNTYTGTTTVLAGTLRLGVTGAVDDLSGLVVNGGIYDIVSFDETVAEVHLISGTITGTSGILTSLTDYDLRSGTVSAIMAGSVGVDKTTPGTVILTRDNIFPGLTTVFDGTLAVTSNNALGTLAAGTLVEGPGTLDFRNVIYGTPEVLTLHGGTIATSTGISSFAGPVRLTANSTASVTGTELTLTGVISESGGSFGLTKTGPGTLVLEGNNTYTGVLQVNAGTAALGNSHRLNDLSSVSVDGGIFDIRTFDETVNGVHLISGTITGSIGVLTSNTNYDLRSGTVSAIITGGVGVDKTTAGTVTLTRNNTYLGATAVDGGTLVVTAPTALGDTGNGTTVANGATLSIVNTAIVTEPVTLNGNGVGNLGALTGTGIASLAGAVNLFSDSRIGVNGGGDALTLTGTGTVIGPGALDLVGAGTVTFGATVGAGLPLLSLTQSAATRLNINGGLVRTVFNQTYDGPVTTGGATLLQTLANGMITASGQFIATAGPLILDTGAGAAAFLNPLNDFGTVQVTSGGAVSLVDANSIAFNNANLGSLLARALAGNVTLDGSIVATGAGNAIVLVANGNFINNVGPAALGNLGPGRWLVYSTNPAFDTRGGLVYNFKQYGATFPGTPVAQPAGNGFLYSFTPIVTPTLVGSTTKEYDGTNAATLTAANYIFIGAIDGDTVTLNNSTTGVYDTPNVGTGKLVTATGLSVAGATNGAANVYGYQIAVAGASGNIGEITPAPLTVTAANQNKPYGQTLVFAGTEFTSVGLKGVETIGNVVLASAGAAPTAHVVGGPYAITGSAASGGTFLAGNYTITYTNGQLTVTPAPLTVTADNRVKAYGTPVVFAGTEFSSAGLQNGETIGSVTLVSAGASPLASVAGSPYPIVPSAATGGTFTPSDYTINYANGTFTVNTAGVALTVTANNLNKFYGTTLNFTGSEFTATGLQNGETIGSVVLASPGAAATATVAGGPYVITASGASGGTFNPGNYTIGYVDGQLTVVPAPLIIRVGNVNRVIGLPNPTFNVTYSGFQLGQTPAVLTGALALTTAANAGSAPGFYPIVLSGLTAANYAISFVSGILSVTALFDPTDLIVAMRRLGVWELATDMTCLSDDIAGASVARRGVGAKPPSNCTPTAPDTSQVKKVKK